MYKQTRNDMNTYALRAEAPRDIMLFIKAIRNESAFKQLLIPDDVDASLVFLSGLSLDELRECIGGIDDGHVMRQTVMPISEYTGERNYEL